MTSVWRNAGWLLGLTIATTSCSKNEDVGPDYDALFVSQSSAANTKTVFGIWGNRRVKTDDTYGKYTYESRFKLEASKVTVATRCTREKDGATTTVGVAAEATVTEDHVSIKEDKQAEVKYGPESGDLKQDTCTVTASKFEDDLVLTGGKLTFAGDVFDKFAD